MRKHKRKQFFPYSLPYPGNLSFPDKFIWGVSTSDRQITENIDRGLSIWDAFAMISGKIEGGYDPRITCEHMRYYKEDVALMKQLGAGAYRLSIAWPRWQSEGLGQPNQSGIDFYDRLIDQLCRLGIDPWITLFHWDLPLELECLGGWQNRDTAKRFADYVFSVVSKLGDRVKHWMTLNEPNIFAFQGYLSGEFAPGKHGAWLAAFRAVHHLLLAHGMGMQVIRQASSDAKVGIVVKMLPVETLSYSPLAHASAHLWRMLGTSWFLDPLLRGSYPLPVRGIYDAMSAINRLGRHSPVVRAGDMEIICPKKRMDFLGIDYYFRQVINFLGQWRMHVPGSQHTAMGWEICAAALARGLIRLKEEYGELLPIVYITENGMASDDVLVNGQVNDQQRIDYLIDHLIAVLQAIAAGVDVGGYFVWSLIRNWEWPKGLLKDFGIVYVDFKSPERTRTPKSSFYVYQDVIRGNGLIYVPLSMCR